MRTLFLLQLALPVFLAGWLILRPAQSVAGLAAQATGSMLLLAGLVHVGLWLFPPWWTPYAAMIVLAAAVVWHLGRRRWSPTFPADAWGWTGAAVTAALGLAGISMAARAAMAADPPREPAAVRLEFPLTPGRYLIANGGTWGLMNAHRRSMDTAIARLRPWRGNGHAVDIVALHRSGFRSAGVLPKRPRAYAIFGARVVAPCTGSVVMATDGLPDMPVPEFDRDHMAGNHVMLDCDGIHVVLAHLQLGSVAVRPGDYVTAGTPIAAVGNSGGTSEPHLHIHAQLPGPQDAPMAGDPLPILLSGRFLVRGDRMAVR